MTYKQLRFDQLNEARQLLLWTAKTVPVLLCGDQQYADVFMLLALSAGRSTVKYDAGAIEEASDALTRAHSGVAPQDVLIWYCGPLNKRPAHSPS